MTSDRECAAQADAARHRGDVAGAEKILRAGLKQFPKSAGLHVELGNLYLDAADTARAERAYRKAIRAAPRDATAHGALGNALKAQDNLDGAITAYRRALNFDPGAAPVLFNLGIALRENGDLDEAVEAYDRALAIAPDVAAIWYNRANAQSYLGDHTAAIESYDEALRRRPDYTEAQFSKAVALLLDGDFAAGWDLHETRFKASTFDTPDRTASCPRWAGEDPHGKTIAIWGEQGIGDEARFLSCLPDLIAAVGKTGKVIYDCAPRLETLVRRSFPSVEVRPSPPKSTSIDAAADFHLPVGSLPRYFRRSLEAFGTPRPILTADPARVAYWQAWLASLGDAATTVGISWRSGSKGTRKQLRYAPTEAWTPLLQTPGAIFVCLQYDDCADEIAAIKRSTGVDVHMPPGLDRRDDFENLAALDVALDFVVSCANTVGDLAGAVGTRTLVIEHGSHWPWGLWPEAGDAGQMWYPDLTLLSARDLGGWDAAFAEAVRRIKA